MEISVVIACYDANETLRLQLESLAHQEHAPAFEVLVVNNNSPVAPDDVVRGWADALDIRVVRATECQGVAYARNVGVREARSDRVAFCDADDCAGPRFVRAAFDALERAPFVTGGVHTLTTTAFDAGRSVVWRELALRHPATQSLEVIDEPYPIFMGGASAVERRAFIDLGGFDQAYVPGAEDNDLGLRVVRSGRTLLRSPDMTLAERPRRNASRAFRRSYDAGLMHMRLCAEHDLWAVSPHLHEPEWWRDLLRLPAACLVTMLTDRSPSGRHGVASRAGLRLGQLAGSLEYRALRRRIAHDSGRGLIDLPSTSQ